MARVQFRVFRDGQGAMIGELFELNNGLSGAPVWALAAAALWGAASMLLSPCHLAGIPLILGFISGQGMDSSRLCSVV
jgi:cytochrome c-type biogenesis protein